MSDLVKVYPGGIRAVDGISFSVAAGEIFGFLGPNGAGKTTTIRMLITLLRPTAGRMLIDGIDVMGRPEEIRRRIGYAAQTVGIDDDLTATENLVLQGRLHHLDRVTAAHRADELLEIADLADVRGRRAGTFSGGMRRRLDLAQALVHRPRLLFLDEPTTGLDPQNRRAMWAYLDRLHADGVTIFLTTQYLEEADELAGRLAIIDHGTIVAEGSPDSLKEALGGDVISVTIGPDEDPGLARDVLTRLEGAGEVEVYDHTISVFVPDGATRLAETVRRLDAAGVAVSRLELAEPTLDDVFLRVTGERLRVEEVKPPSHVRFGPRSRRS